MIMKKVMMDVLIFFIFLNQVLLTFGKVTIIYNSYSLEMKLICVSEDDGGALVWNTGETDTEEIKHIGDYGNILIFFY